MTASFHCCGTFPSRQMRVVSRWNSSRKDPILLESEFQQFRGKSVRSHCFLVCHCFHRCGNLLLRGLDPEGTRDLYRPLGRRGYEAYQIMPIPLVVTKRYEGERVRPW